MTTTVRISEDAHARLVALSTTTGRRMHVIVEDALAAYESDLFWDDLTTGYARLAGDAAEWVDLAREREAEQAVLRDGLSEDR